MYPNNNMNNVFDSSNNYMGQQPTTQQQQQQQLPNYTFQASGNSTTFNNTGYNPYAAAPITSSTAPPGINQPAARQQQQQQYYPPTTPNAGGYQPQQTFSTDPFSFSSTVASNPYDASSQFNPFSTSSTTMPSSNFGGQQQYFDPQPGYGGFGLPPAAPIQQNDQMDLIAKVQNLALQKKQQQQAYQPPPTNNTGGFDFGMMSGTTPTGASAAASRRPAPMPQQQPVAKSDAFDPFATYHPPPEMTNYTFSSGAPFDDAGFFSNAPAAVAAKPSSASKPPAATYRQPTPEDEALLRRASILFEQGIYTKEDKTIAQDMVLQGNEAFRKALMEAQRGDNGQAVIKALRAYRTKGAKKDSDSDSDSGGSDSDGTMSGDDEKNTSSQDASALAAESGEVAPHPRAGGWTGVIPTTLFMFKEQFCGNILIRISSKKLFRKWKPVFVAVDVHRVSVYASRRDWEAGGPTKFVFPLHSAMWVAKPSLKRTYSVVDDGRRVYFTTIRENTKTDMSFSGPQKYSPTREYRTVAKFGSYYPNEIGSLAHAIYACVAYHLKPKAPDSAAKSISGVSRASGRYS